MKSDGEKTPGHDGGDGKPVEDILEPEPTDVPPTTMHGFAKHAFISHSSQDREWAERVCAVLEGFGLNCWMAPRNIDPGAPYDEELLRGIECSQTFILLLSDAANASPHVKRELMCALRAGHAVYPIRIQEVQPGRKLEYLLEGIHWVDAWKPPIEAHLERLAQLIAGHHPDVDNTPRAMKRNQPGRKHGIGRMAMAGIATALAVAALGFASRWFISKDQQSTNQEAVPASRQSPGTVTNQDVLTAAKVIVAKTDTQKVSPKTDSHQAIANDSVTAVRLENKTIAKKGSPVGIEAGLQKTNDQILIATAYHDSPAKKAGLEMGQTITVINAIPTASVQPVGQWTNSLGMVFVSVPGTAVQFSIWDTRVQDYQTFVTATERLWGKPGFKQGPTHPAVKVSWDDAKAFCSWLTEKEHRAGTLNSTQEYRLPTDAEWSTAAGLENEIGVTPKERIRNDDVYPWGTQWPPPRGSGNYSSSLNVDNFKKTSPVGSFVANRFGLYDMVGNVWQYCEDLRSGQSDNHVLRGGSWNDHAGAYPRHLRVSWRDDDPPWKRPDTLGFRCVLVSGTSGISKAK